MKNKYHTVTTVPKPNRNNRRKRQNSYPYQTNLKLVPLSNKFKIDTLIKQIHDRSHSWLGTGTSVKSDQTKNF